MSCNFLEAPFVALTKITDNTKKKLNVKKLVSQEDATHAVKKQSMGKIEGISNNTGDSPAKKKRPITENGDKRKKSSTPTPYSNATLNKNGFTGKSLTSLKEKSLPLHQQPRQFSAAVKKKPDGVRPATPKTVSPKRDLHGVDLSASKANNIQSTPRAIVPGPAHGHSQNPAPGKASLFYSNLLKVKNDKEVPSHASEKSTSKENHAKNAAAQPVPKSKPYILTATGGVTNSILKGLEESANKKLNKHSSSLDNTDWMACYEKIRKDLNVNSPKDIQTSAGRISVNSVRPAGNVVLLSEYVPKRPLVTPVPSSNPFQAKPQTARPIEGHAVKKQPGKPKPALVTGNGKLGGMLLQLGGKQGVFDKGAQRPVVLAHHKR